MALLDSDIDIERLCDDIRRSRRALERPRRERMRAVQQMVGSHHSEDGADNDVLVNLISLYHTLIARDLVSQNPRVMLSTFKRQHKPVVSAMENWCNQEVDRLHLQEALQGAVSDGLFAVGICKVSLADPAMAAGMAWSLKAGEPFVELIDLDDWVHDHHGTSPEHWSYMGHHYRVPLRVVKASKLYSKERLNLTASDDQQYNADGDERIATIDKGAAMGSAEEFEDMVDLWEIYLPRHRLVLTLADDGGNPASVGDGKALRAQRWIGPDNGPYHILGFGKVPGNAMPLAPVQNLIGLHKLVNEIYRKLSRQAQRLKQLTLVVGGTTEDGETLRNASDGDMPVVSRADSTVPVASAGPNPQLTAMFDQARQLFSWLAGNLDAIGGLSPQSKTATQDTLLSQNSSKTVVDMQGHVLRFTTSVTKALCWFWYHDPLKVMKTAQVIRGLPGGSIEQTVRPAGQPGMARNFHFDDMDIRVDPYSLQAQTPQGRLAAMNQVVTQIVIPMMQLLQQQGVSFDVNAYLQKVGRYLDMPDLAEILSIIEPPSTESSSGQGEKPGMPAQTERKYVRENMPGRTDRGDALNRMNAMQGIDVGGAPKNGQVRGI